MSLFLIYCELPFDDIDLDLANYTDDTTPYAYNLENNKTIKLLEKNIEKLFDWFSDNFLKANPDTCHLLTNIDGNIKSNKDLSVVLIKLG